MQIIIFLVALLFGCYSCSPNKKILMCKEQINQCNEIEAGNIADCAMKKYKYEIETLNRTVTELDSVFLIQYMPKDTIMIGGGGEIKVSKERCKILDIKFYQ